MMRKLISLILFFICLNAQALVLTVPDNFRVLAVNNHKLKQTLLINKTQLKLRPGRHELTLQYVDMFDSAYHDDHTKVESQPFILSFTIQDESRLSFVHPKIIDLKSAQRYAQTPTVEIYNEFGKAINVVHSMAADSDNASEVAQTSASQPSTSPESLAMLKYWWKNASDADRSAFLDFVNQQKRK